MQVGFIGLGRMGSGMAANLLAAGHTLTVYNRNPAKAEALVAKGAQLAKTPGDAARGDVVITMLADDRALEHVVFGENGILPALAPGAIHVSMSTISVALAERLAAAHREKDQEFMSATVFGRPDLGGFRQALRRGGGQAGNDRPLQASVRRAGPAHFRDLGPGAEGESR